MSEGEESNEVRVLDNGAVVIPAIQTTGNALGQFRNNRPCEELGGKQMTITPQVENFQAEWWLRKAIFASPKKYEITLRVQTDDDQGQAGVFLRLNREEPFYETSISIPNTNGQWQTIGPFLLDVDFGGFKDTVLRLCIPKINGQVFNMKDIKFSPPGADETGDYSGPWFAKWLDELQAKIIDGGKVPSLEDSDKDSLSGTATEFQAAWKREREEGDAELQKEAKVAKDKAMQDCMTAATPILERMGGALEGLVGLEEKELLQWLVLVQATPTKLGSYCHEASKDKVEKLMKLLKEDMQLLKLIIISGGAKDGRYGEALDIYYEIQESMNKEKSVLPKLQLAIALELCKPLAIFDTVTPLDPIKRYFDYEKAYLEGDLDPAFEHFSVWELRMVVDSDASNEELVWGREMLYCYRPDMIYMGDQTWRYSSIVKTDVKYKNPDWTSQPRDMVQALARGGKCGPRAFFGRFINKAFGNPTWGVTQPSHAALYKWAPTGWDSCLGGQVGFWDGRDLSDFKYEVYIRKKFGDAAYFCKVELLEWIGVALGSTPKEKNSYPHVDAPWHTLALLQRKRLGDTDKPFPQPEIGECEVLTKITQMQQRVEPNKEEIIVQDDGTIIIPSSARDSERLCNFCKSLEGGKQFSAENGWWLNFKLPAEVVPERKTYKLTMRIASVHDDDLHPFQWIITSVHNKAEPVKEYIVNHPYTKGLWQETDPVEIELGGGDEVLKLMRQSPCWPITVKDFKLCPV